MTQRQLFAAAFFVVLLWLLYQIVIIFKPFMLPVLWAVVLAHTTYPLHARLARALGDRPTVSAAVLTAAVLGLVVVPVAVLTGLLIGEAADAYETINAWIKSGGLATLPTRVAVLPLVGPWLEPVGARLLLHPEDAQAFLLENLRGVSAFLVAQVSGLAANAFLLVANFLVMIFTLFFLFRDGPRLSRQAYAMIPLDEAHKSKIVARLDVTVTAVVKGILVTALVQGLLAGAAYWVLGVPFPVFFMALTTLLSPLPAGGTALVWAPLTVYLFVTAPLWKGIALLAWGGGVVTMADNIVRPWLIGKDAQLPVLFLFFSMVGGLAAYGFIGLLLGPVLLAILMTALQIYREDYQKPAVEVPP